jgi:transposase-like protein
VKPISFKRHRFPADVIRHAVWLYFRFSLSFRDVEELMAQRGIEVSYETIRCWTIKFGRCCQSNDNLSPAGEARAGGVILSWRAFSTRQMRPLFGL